jgi:hypothetical protein
MNTLKKKKKIVVNDIQFNHIKAWREIFFYLLFFNDFQDLPSDMGLTTQFFSHLKT